MFDPKYLLAVLRKRALHRMAWMIVAFVCLNGHSAADAQEWATKMFKVRNHDFGSVARGAKAEFRFEFQNLYEEDIHIAGVRSSCGCTTPSVTKSTLKTWETAHVVAKYNTRSFLGQKGATITLVIDEPHYAEVQLSVDGYIRSDVVFDPGEVNLGELDQTESKEMKVSVNYAGREDWRIVDVRSANRRFEVELAETNRQAGRVGYDMLIRLVPGSPAGYIQDQLTVVTNDANLNTIPLAVQGRVVSAVTVSPASLFLGVLKPGDSVTKKLVLRAKTPFRVVNVSCKDDCFEIEPPKEESSKLHFIAVKFTAGETTGKVSEAIQIETDLTPGAATECQASATIVLE